LKKFNPVNEQFSSCETQPWVHNDFTIAKGLLDPLHIWELVRRKLDIEIMNEIKWSMYDNYCSIEMKFHTAWQTYKYGYNLWTGADFTENIVKNTRMALKYGQRGFVCGNRSDQGKDDYWDFNEIKKSLELWRKYS
jgi:hypothetical protein